MKLHTIKIQKNVLITFDNKRPYTIDGKQLKNGDYRELIIFTDGTKIRVVYLQ